MENTTGGLTFANIFPLILAILLIFLLPMLMRRYGLGWEDITRLLFSRFGKKKDYADTAGKAKREPWQTNGRSQDIQSLVSTLLIFVRRNKLGLVYPGTVEHKGKMANLVALLVTGSEVIGINCFGFGGTITEQGGKWNQHMNGADQPIPDPVDGCHRQAEIVRAAMNDHGMAEIPMRVVAVFTSHTVSVRPENEENEEKVFDTKGLLSHLKGCVAQENRTIDPEEVSRQLNGCVRRIKAGGKK